MIGMARRLHIISAIAVVFGAGAGLYLFMKSKIARAQTPQQQTQQLQLKVEIVCEKNYKLCDTAAVPYCVYCPEGNIFNKGQGYCWCQPTAAQLCLSGDIFCPYGTTGYLQGYCFSCDPGKEPVIDHKTQTCYCAQKQ
jgi:hypothetical protein